MIGRLTGVLVEKSPPYLLVDVNGVGYEIQASMTSICHLPGINKQVLLHTHLSISENAHQLFGFYSQSERELFRALIKVSGVGPKLALSILSGIEADAFVRCIMDGDAATLVKVPGVGKKTAERLVVEMRDRLKDWQLESSPLAALEAASNPQATSNTGDMIAEAESALVALGYKPTEATKMVAVALQQSNGEQHQLDRSEDLIRLALRSVL